MKTTSSHISGGASEAPVSTLLVQSLLAARTSIPREVLYKARLHIIDSIAIGVAARDNVLAGRVARAQQLLQGGGTSPCIGGGSASPAGAAFINASLIHILDYDDIYDAGRLHPSAVIVPAVYAAADIALANDDAITEAVVLGSELMCRLADICSPKGKGAGADWFLTQVFGYIGAAFAAGLVLGLSKQELVSCIGLAYMQAAGGKQAGFGTGATARAIYPAFAAQGGVQAAVLAQQGVVGPEGSLDGAAGLFNIYFGLRLSSAQKESLIDFTSWLYRDVSIKCWPSCRLSHPYVSVAAMAKDDVAQRPEAMIQVAVNASAGRLCHPLEQRRQPLTIQDAKYSIPFMVAFTLVHGAPTLNTINEQTLKDRQVLAMAERILIEESLLDNPGHPNATLSLWTDGRKVSEYGFNVADLAMGSDAVRSKVESCFDAVGLKQRVVSVWDSIVKRGHVQDAVKSTAS